VCSTQQVVVKVKDDFVASFLVGHHGGILICLGKKLGKSFRHTALTLVRQVNDACCFSDPQVSFLALLLSQQHRFNSLVPPQLTILTHAVQHEPLQSTPRMPHQRPKVHFLLNIIVVIINIVIVVIRLVAVVAVVAYATFVEPAETLRIGVLTSFCPQNISAPDIIRYLACFGTNAIEISTLPPQPFRI